MLLPCRQTEQPGTAVESWRWSGPHHLSCVEPHQTLPAPQSNSKGVGPPHGSTGHHEQDDASCYCAVVTRPEGGAVCANAQRTTYNNDCLASRVRRNRLGNVPGRGDENQFGHGGGCVRRNHQPSNPFLKFPSPFHFLTTRGCGSRSGRRRQERSPAWEER